jgi:hypothetical protein
MSAQPSSPDRRLYSKLATAEQTVSWTIDNFPFFVRTTENAEALTSPKFEILVPGKDGNIAKTRWTLDCYPKGNVPDPDPHFFGPSGSGSTSQRYGSGSFYHHAKIVRTPLIPTIL